MSNIVCSLADVGEGATRICNASSYGPMRHDLAGIQDLPADPLRADERAVGAAEIFDDARAAGFAQHGVLPADLRILQADAAAGIAADHEIPAVQRVGALVVPSVARTVILFTADLVGGAVAAS